jgi:glycosyltransferase involved in cell wall biosynthesis
MWYRDRKLIRRHAEAADRGDMRISIVTLALNLPPYLAEALASVDDHAGLDIEHIIVHDGPEATFQELAQRYPAIRIVRGRAAGATAAAAQGVEAATGDFILLLHSDDRLGKGALAALAAATQARPEIRIWSGSIRIFRMRATGEEVTVRQLNSRYDTRPSLANICDNVPMLTARFIHRSVYATLGNFDLDYPESSDREFMVRAVMASIPEAPLDACVSEMRMHDESRTVHGRTSAVPPYLTEHLRIADKWLQGRNSGDSERQFFRNWRARESLRLFIYQCRTGSWKKAWTLLCSCNKTDPLWCFRACSALPAIWRRNRSSGS